MARYLLDSDVLIWVLRGRQDTVALLDRLAVESGETLACSAMSVLEIWAGAKPTEAADTATFLDALEVIPVDRVVASRAADAPSIQAPSRPSGMGGCADRGNRARPSLRPTTSVITPIRRFLWFPPLSKNPKCV